MRGSTRITVCMALVLSVVCAMTTAASSQSRVPTVPFVKKALKVSKGRWIAFRNFHGNQLVYFSSLVTWKCAISELRYSVNGTALDQRWPLPSCNPHVPYNIDLKTTKVLLTLPLGQAKSVSVQIVFKDGSKSAVRSFGPCNVTGDVTCGVPVRESDLAQEKTAIGGGGQSGSGSAGRRAAGSGAASSGAGSSSASIIG